VVSYGNKHGIPKGFNLTEGNWHVILYHAYTGIHADAGGAGTGRKFSCLLPVPVQYTNTGVMLCRCARAPGGSMTGYGKSAQRLRGCVVNPPE
jgi:hypothetical protein